MDKASNRIDAGTAAAPPMISDSFHMRGMPKSPLFCLSPRTLDRPRNDWMRHKLFKRNIGHEANPDQIVSITWLMQTAALTYDFLPALLIWMELLNHPFQWGRLTSTYELNQKPKLI
ncbi:hypothetical protein TNIN_264731 [Trichonephila inaurata madagascariensis]|uniref:Uncharacterized protein n=1 Tax=Trichonephila inaurata madagascariensis TaxID=2747483 RepID=A0A8X6WZ24_9ARAC|nr:hypothetical protein TNIN_264731 [Trichonephila inaurata madagascariensis]